MMMEEFNVHHITENNEKLAFFKSLPPGFRFCPSDRELIQFYLMNKIMGRRLPINPIEDVTFYNLQPKQLAEKYEQSIAEERYFFTQRSKKYPNGTRPNRAVPGGYWKAVGSDKLIENSQGVTIGFRKSLDFLEGKHPDGFHTDWKMHEYCVHPNVFTIPNPGNTARKNMWDEWVLCKLYKKRKAKFQIEDGKDKAVVDDDRDIEEDELQCFHSADEALCKSKQPNFMEGGPSRTPQSPPGMPFYAFQHGPLNLCSSSTFFEMNHCVPSSAYTGSMEAGPSTSQESPQGMALCSFHHGPLNLSFPHDSSFGIPDNSVQPNFMEAGPRTRPMDPPPLDIPPSFSFGSPMQTTIGQNFAWSTPNGESYCCCENDFGTEPLDSQLLSGSPILDSHLQAVADQSLVGLAPNWESGFGSKDFNFGDLDFSYFENKEHRIDSRYATFTSH